MDCSRPRGHEPQRQHPDRPADDLHAQQAWPRSHPGHGLCSKGRAEVRPQVQTVHRLHRRHGVERKALGSAGGSKTTG